MNQIKTCLIIRAAMNPSAANPQYATLVSKLKQPGKVKKIKCQCRTHCEAVYKKTHGFSKQHIGSLTERLIQDVGVARVIELFNIPKSLIHPQTK
jgi:hypothetical protein